MSFDRLAPFYRVMELALAGDKLQRCRLAWLDEVRGARSILLVGEGHGRLLEVCVNAFPGARITCVDASRSMLRIAERRWRAAGGKAGVVEFIHAELPDWNPPHGSFDLVATNFFLDCFPPETLPEVVAKLAQSASPRAHWLVSDFTVPQWGWRRWRAQLILAAAYGFFRCATGLKAREITPPDSYLSAAGFRLRGRQSYEWGLLHADLWERRPDE